MVDLTIFWNASMRRSRSGKERPVWSPSDYGRRAMEPGAKGWKQNKRTKDRRTTRAEANKRAHLDEDIPVPRNHSIARDPHTRQQKIRCTFYGPYRTWSIFPFNFLCAECSIWDSLVTSGSVGQNRRDSTWNECTARHTDVCYPMQVKPGVIRIV